MSNVIICGVRKEQLDFVVHILTLACLYGGRKVRLIRHGTEENTPSCHFRTGENVFSPVIAPGQADLILALEPGEAVRELHYLKKDGHLILVPEAVMPEKDCGYSPGTCVAFLKRRVKNLHIVSSDGMRKTAGKPTEKTAGKPVTGVLAGAALQAGKLGIPGEFLEKAVHHIFAAGCSFAS